MSSVETENMIVGLDIGTSKVVAIVGKRKMDGTIEVVGIGSHPSRGLKRGVVVNISATPIKKNNTERNKNPEI